MKDYKTKTLESYNEHSEYFSNKFAKGYSGISYFMDRFASLCNGKKVLDLGCGGGDHALIFKNKGFDVSCGDISEKMVEICKGKGLSAEIMDMENLKFVDGSFDGIWASTSLTHLPKSNFPAVIDKISSILKDKGMLFVSVRKGKEEGFFDDRHLSGAVRFFSHWEQEELISLFKESFEVVDKEDVNSRGRDFLLFLFRKK